MEVILTAKERRGAFRLDPRTKIALTLIIGIVMMSGGFSGASRYVRPLLALIPLGLLLAEGRHRQSLFYFVFLALSMGVETFLLQRTQGALNLILVIFSGLVSRFVPGLVMGYYLVSTTRISELIAALERMRMPRQVVIPFAVMMRFFPTVAEENRAISDAMRQRGIRLGGKNAGAILEYRIVPLLMCAVKTGEELSAAALTRGLGKPVKRTSLCEVCFSAADYLLLGATLLAFAAFLLF